MKSYLYIIKWFADSTESSTSYQVCETFAISKQVPSHLKFLSTNYLTLESTVSKYNQYLQAATLDINLQIWHYQAKVHLKVPNTISVDLCTVSLDSLQAQSIWYLQVSFDIFKHCKMSITRSIRHYQLASSFDILQEVSFARKIHLIFASTSKC